ncbi:MAG: LysR family transcriptional regulator ArgP, partial [Pseudomonadota bacterium]
QFDPHQLAALSAILRLGSFEAAADHLAVTPSAISQRIRALEDRVGSPLVHRGSPCRGTATGQRLAKHAEDIGLLEAQVSRDLALDQAKGTARLRVALNADSLATWFVAAMAQTENVLFDIVIDDQEHSADWLRRGDVSAAVTAGGKPVIGCDTIELGAMRYLATASPSFVHQWFSDGVTRESLALAPCLTYNSKDQLQKMWVSENIGQTADPPTHFLPSTHAFVDAARAGLGWGMNPAQLVRGPIRNGRLVQLIDNTPLDIPLTWQVSRVLAPALQPLTAAVKKAAAKGLIENG